MYFSSVLIMDFGGGIHFIQELYTRTDSFKIKKYHWVSSWPGTSGQCKETSICCSFQKAVMQSD